jgi:hypothetical protein
MRASTSKQSGKNYGIDSVGSNNVVQLTQDKMLFTQCHLKILDTTRTNMAEFAQDKIQTYQLW